MYINNEMDKEEWHVYTVEHYLGKDFKGNMRERVRRGTDQLMDIFLIDFRLVVR